MSRLPELLRAQARGCAELGSPLYDELLRAVADDVEDGGDFAQLLAGHEDDRARSAVGLRLMGAVHRLVLERKGPGLALHYPSVGGAPGPDVWGAFRTTALAHADEVRALLAIPPQTNEIGRAAALAGGLLLVAERTGLPLRLLEIGSSGGLNLNVDRYRYDLDAARVLGDLASPARLSRPWAGQPETWPSGVLPRIVDRRGCDPDPVDVRSERGRLTLTSYVWADQVSRFERLRGALEVAGVHPPQVDRATAGEWLQRQLAAPTTDVATVVWHSVVWQYLDDAERARVTDALETAGAAATEHAPLAHLSLEPGGRLYLDKFAFAVTLRLWPHDPEPRVVATAGGHGPPVTWL